MAVISGGRVCPSGRVVEETGNNTPLVTTGAPVDGAAGTFAGRAAVGAILRRTDAATRYKNTGTQAAPVWTAI